MLQTTQNSIMKNNTTKSVILAPFNSTRSHISDDFFKRDSIQDLLVSNTAMVFEDRCREVNRQYMLNNNAELDNGVYNEAEEKKEEAKKDELVGLDDKIESEQPAEEPSNQGPVVAESAMQSVLNSLNTSQVAVDEDRIEKMEQHFGYGFDYVVDQIENDQLNHASTCYFLLDCEKEF
jgi:uncharacterized protein YlxW (UPF0749 family)